ncbi:MAG: ParA family protein [Patulibacter sp.]|nr:ParA family protein [Patulibacter sp.]
MSAQRVAIFNQKGGVAKTTTTKDLGFALAERGLRVLAVELDPQANLAIIAGLGNSQPAHLTVARLLTDPEFEAMDVPDDERAPLLDAIRETPWGVPLVPAYEDLVTAKTALTSLPQGMGAEQRLRDALDAIEQERAFDVILMDCPPAADVLSMNALVAADWVLIPTGLTTTEVSGISAMIRTVTAIQKHSNPGLKYAGVLGTRFKKAEGHQVDVAHGLEKQFPPDGPIPFLPMIRNATCVNDASAARQAVGDASPSHPVVKKDYRKLVDRLVERLDLKVVEVSA